MKIRLYDDLYGSTVILKCREDGTCWADDVNEYTAISEVIEVEFPMIDGISLEEAKIKAIDERISKVQADCEVKVNQLKDERQKLLAIGHEGE